MWGVALLVLFIIVGITLVVVGSSQEHSSESVLMTTIGGLLIFIGIFGIFAVLAN